MGVNPGGTWSSQWLGFVDFRQSYQAVNLYFPDIFLEALPLPVCQNRLLQPMQAGQHTV